jgi:hypothetical protein
MPICNSNFDRQQSIFLPFHKTISSTNNFNSYQALNLINIWNNQGIYNKIISKINKNRLFLFFSLFFYGYNILTDFCHT